MISKKDYVVTFFKTVATDFGQDREIKQRIVVVCAPNEREALKEAKAEFCRKERLMDWALHADRCEVTESTSPAEGIL
jgi:hypothetical protein